MRTYHMRLGDNDVIFRELKLGEWGSLANFPSESISLYAKAAEYAILKPTYVDLRPGEILYLGERIIQLSSRFSDANELNSSVNKIHTNIEDSIHMIPVLICSVFPAYTPEMVLEFDFETLVIRMAQVRWINEQAEGPAPPPEGADPLQAKSIDHSKNALDRALREEQHKKGAPNVN